MRTYSKDTANRILRTTYEDAGFHGNYAPQVSGPATRREMEDAIRGAGANPRTKLSKELFNNLYRLTSA